MMTFGRVSRCAILLAVLTGSGAWASGSTGINGLEAPLVLQPCRAAGLEEEVRCGMLSVLEDRSKPAGRKIPIHVMVLPAFKSSKPPIFILQGGPGQAATGLAEFYAETFADARRERDIVLIDQRGTGKSNPLQCQGEGSEDNLQGYLHGLFPLKVIRRCRAALEQKADLRLYTTEAAIDDLDNVRAALKHGSLSFYGTSYGTRAALAYARKYPRRVERMILKGVLGFDVIAPLSFAVDSQRSLERVIADCEAEADCRTRFPTFAADVDAVFARLERSPARVIIAPKEGRKQTVTLSRQVLATSLRSLLQSTSSQILIPSLFQAAERGNLTPLTEIILQLRRAGEIGIFQGMQLSVLCSEDAPLIPVGEENRNRQTFLGRAWTGPVMAACREWPKGKVPGNFRKSVRLNIPTLLISGFSDPATPPAGAERVRRSLPNSRHVVIRYGSHSFAGLRGCVDNIMVDFLAGTAPVALDIRCADQVRRPPWAAAQPG